MRATDFYDEILRRTGFAIPALYRRMEADGVLRYGASRGEWQATWKVRSVTNPPALLCVREVEWMPLERVAAWTPPDHWNCVEPFIAFASTGTGDRWCWYPSWQTDGEGGIALAMHDENRTKLYAPSFEAFLWRQMLDACAQVDPWTLEHDDLTLDGVRETLVANISTLKPYLRPMWTQHLEVVVGREFVEYREKLPRAEYNYFAPLARAEYDGLMADLQAPRLNESFGHLRREPIQSGPDRAR